MKTYFIGALVLLGFAPLAKSQYAFGGAVSSGSATETYNSGTQTFSYIDSNTVGDDNSYVPLQGSGASFISLTSSWQTTLTVSLSATTLSKGTDASPQFGGGLVLIGTEPGGDEDFASMSLSQNNNTGSTNNTDVPANFFGTLAEFEVDSDGDPQTTSTLGSASNYQGTSYKSVAGGTNSIATTESIAAVSETLSLNFNASTETLTGSLNGSAIGSFNLSALPAGSTLTLGVAGFSGEGVAVTSGMLTANNFGVAPEPPVWLLMSVGLTIMLGFRRLAGA